MKNQMISKVLFVFLIGGLATLSVLASFKYLIFLLTTVGLKQVFLTCVGVSIVTAFIGGICNIIKEIAKKLEE